MPFHKTFNDVWATIKLSVAEATKPDDITCTRLDEIRAAGRISDDLVSEIEKATLCIADITGNNPNVMWEVGYAMARAKPTVFLSQDIDDLPFDIKDMRVIKYDRDDLHGTLKTSLRDAVIDTLGRYNIEPEPYSDIGVAKEKTSFSVAVTGSMDTHPIRCLKHIQEVLSPYLCIKTSWYVGSYGVVDEIAAEFLVSKEQKVKIVGYHSYDLSSKMLQIIKKYKLPFIDAKESHVPLGIKAPSERDLFFYTRADLIMLFWNGKSKGTKEMISWYKNQGKDHLVIFV